MIEWPCGMPTRRGRPCPIPVSERGKPCATHNPDGVYARKHPGYRERLLASSDRPDPDAEIRAWPKLWCGLCKRPVPFGEPIRGMSSPVGGKPVFGHVSCVLDAMQKDGGEAMSARP